MSKLRLESALAAIILYFAVSGMGQLSAQTTSVPAPPPDETLYTSYYFESGYQDLTWVVCGSTAETEGCYGSGSLGPFGRVGALMEGNPTTDAATNTVTRVIYVVDVGSGSDGTAVVLHAYRKKDTVTSESDTITVVPIKAITLPLTGGGAAVCSMAANGGYLFIGTDQSPQAVRVQKSDFTIVQIGGGEPPENVTAITADKYGYVSVIFGNGEFSGIVQFGPDGQGEGDGGGAWFLLNTVNGVSTSNFPLSAAQPPLQLGYKSKSAQK
jgi:hypothetical protein